MPRCMPACYTPPFRLRDIPVISDPPRLVILCSRGWLFYLHTLRFGVQACDLAQFPCDVRARSCQLAAGAGHDGAHKVSGWSCMPIVHGLPSASHQPACVLLPWTHGARQDAGGVVCWRRAGPLTASPARHHASRGARPSHAQQAGPSMRKVHAPAPSAPLPCSLAFEPCKQAGSNNTCPALQTAPALSKRWANPTSVVTICQHTTHCDARWHTHGSSPASACMRACTTQCRGA